MQAHLGLTCLLASIVLCAQHRALARDLAKTDPDRKAILDAARGDDDVKLVVKDLFKDGETAFLCALLRRPDGTLFRTDESLDVYQWVLFKDGATWVAVSAPGGFAPDTRRVDCSIQARVAAPSLGTIGSGQDIARVLADLIRDGLLDELDYGKVDAHWLALLDLARRRGVLTDVSVDRAKDKLDSTQLAVSDRRCPTQACIDENRKAFEAINAWSSDPTISSLVWKNCQRGLRVGNLVAIDRCLTAMAARPHCRPGMKLPADRKDVDRCLTECHDLCVRILGEGTCR